MKEFNKRFGTEKPNLEVIQKLQDAGVKIILCGQSMMKQDLLPAQINSGVILSSSRIVAQSEHLKKATCF
jgi:intracellular sulfur oxidation DsrE/DsrF family protein